MLPSCHLAALGILVAGVAAVDDDPVKKQLETAKMAYESKMEKFGKAAEEWFEKREDVARKDGDKKLVDQIKAERQRFTEKGELPKAAPMDLKKPRAAAQAAMETAYAAAVKEYTKGKKDDEAAAVEKELTALRAAVGDRKKELELEGLSDSFQPKTVWSNEKLGFVLKVIERKGEKFRARFEIGDKSVREVAGTIKDNEVSWLAKDVRALKGNPGHDNRGTFGSDMDGKKIDFVWGDNEVLGTYTLRLKKGK